jgi:hypothetical protein
MNHEESIKTKAAEKYLLQELPLSEREAFEMHYFGCLECAEEVRLGFQFRETAIAVFSEDAQPARQAARPARRSAWLSWFAWAEPMRLVPVTACLAVALFSGYQNVVEMPALRARMSQLEKPQVLPATLVLAPSSRASVRSIAVPPAARFFPLLLATGALPPAERYQCDLRSESGKTIWMVPVPTLDADATLNLLIPTSGVPAGYYDAVLLGRTGNATTELEHYHFAVRRE